MQAQAWSYGVSWYSDIKFTFSDKGNKLKLANGNFVISEIYAFNYVSRCVKTKTGKLTLHSGIGNNGGGLVVIAPIVKGDTDDGGKKKGTFFAKGTLTLENMYQHYTLRNYVSGDGMLSCYVDDDPLNPPTGDCTEEDRNPDHPEHFCHAEADQKVEYKDNLYMPQIAVYVRVVKGDGVAPELDDNGEYIVLEQGIAECVYTGEVTQDPEGNFVTDEVNTDCDVTEYPLSVDPRFDHVLSF